MSRSKNTCSNGLEQCGSERRLTLIQVGFCAHRNLLVLLHGQCCRQEAVDVACERRPDLPKGVGVQRVLPPFRCEEPALPDHVPHSSTAQNRAFDLLSHNVAPTRARAPVTRNRLLIALAPVELAQLYGIRVIGACELR